MGMRRHILASAISFSSGQPCRASQTVTRGDAGAGNPGAQPRIRGWANYYRHVVSKQTFSKLDNQLHWVLRRSAKRRHPNKSGDWAFNRYWSYRETRWEFNVGKLALDKHAATEITRHVKVVVNRSPFDGDAAYWSEGSVRNSRSPLRARLIAKQTNRCVWCHGVLCWNDPQEGHHLDGERRNNRLSNLWLVHRHCHDDIHGVGYA